MYRNSLPYIDFPKMVLLGAAAVAAAQNISCMSTAPSVVLYWCALYLLPACAMQSVSVVFALSTDGSYKAIHLFIPACTAGNED